MGIILNGNISALRCRAVISFRHLHPSSDKFETIKICQKDILFKLSGLKYTSVSVLYGRELHSTS